MPAVATHHTATSDATWDAGANTKNIPSDASASVLGDVYAWKPTGDDADSKSNWKFPHHFVDADGKPGAASTVACSAVVGALNGGRGGANIPSGDRRGVYNHVIAHLKDSGVATEDLPELKMAPTRPARTRWNIDTPLATLRERRTGMRGQRERLHRSARVELRAKPNGTGGTSYAFEGYAAAFENPFEMWDWWGDPYMEVLGAGSCNRTLANQADVQFLIGHDESSIPLARTKSGTMTLSADSHGLAVAVPSLDGANPLVQALASAMDRGDMDEMSIGFIATQQQWSPDFSERRITEINLNRGDVSMVCWAANPAANGATMRPVQVSEAAARAAGNREKRTPTAPYTVHEGEANECPQCHSMNDLDARYCDQCGTAVKPTGPAVVGEDETQRCGACGEWNASDAKYCDQCGALLASDMDADDGYYPSAGYYAAGRRGERRSVPGAGEPEEQAPEPDFSSKPAYDPSHHNEDSSPTCPNPDCGAMNSQDAGYCDQCGTVLYDDGGLISDGSLDDVITDASGLIEEEDMTLARMRVRVLQLRG